MLYYYLCAAFTLISSAVSFGFSVEAYLKSKGEEDAALTNAKYAMSRSCSLFLVAIGLLLFVAKPCLIALSLIMIAVQVFDGMIGIRISTFKTVGPLLTAAGNTLFLVLYMLNS